MEILTEGGTMLSRTPVEITEQIINFCKEIDESQKPHYVPVKPEAECKTIECFWNVKNKVKLNGGKTQHGWAIVEWPKMMNEAQFHAIWVSPDNEHIDITPPTIASARNLDTDIFYTGLLFDLFVSVLNIDFAHRHIGIQRSGLEGFVLSDVK